QGQASDVSIHAKEIIRLKKLSIEYLARHTGQEYDKVAADIERDHFMTAGDAVEYHIVDSILKRED
ncbi:MAG: ATP-dependent Clp protease proteolytic subunit, partial [Spirochaetales bacterium]|nr:ATP-dependent Clp protease proteolytic subunit [Spirochaetales bacterium]